MGQGGPCCKMSNLHVLTQVKKGFWGITRQLMVRFENFFFHINLFAIPGNFSMEVMCTRGAHVAKAANYKTKQCAKRETPFLGTKWG